MADAVKLPAVAVEADWHDQIHQVAKYDATARLPVQAADWIYRDGDAWAAANVFGPAAAAVVLPGEESLKGRVAVVVGAGYAAIAGVLKVWRGVNEVISTIMLNYIAIGISAFLLSEPLRNESSGNIAQTRSLPASARLPSLNRLVEAIGFHFPSGVVLRGFLSKLRPVGAVALQGLLFGVAHVDPVRGFGNVGLAMVLSAVGIALGTAAYLTRRIGPTVIAHALFNGVVMVIILSGVADDVAALVRV